MCSRHRRNWQRENAWCLPGALTALGAVGQYVAAVGEGWDGPGRGSATVGYYFQRLTQQLPEDQVRAEILRAMQEWSRVASVGFSPARGPYLERTLNFLFATGNHGDAYPFDGPGSGAGAHLLSRAAEPRADCRRSAL